MTTGPDDDALRQAFAELRRDDASRTPPLAAVLERESPRARSRSPLPAAALAAAVVVASLAVGLLVRQPAPSPPPLPAALAWTAPTDFLLRTPGIEVLETVPHIAPRRSLLSLDGVAAPAQSNRRSPSP